MLATVLFASVLVMLVSLVGKLATWKVAGPLIDRNLHFLVSFAAGVMLIIAYNLSREIIAHSGTLAAGVPWIIAGAISFLIGFRFIPHFHHHHDSGAADHVHMRIDAGRILGSDAIHNVGDGVVLVVSYAASPIIGIASTVSIVAHEMLQEISQFFVLRQTGISVSRALAYNFLASSSILIGTIGSYYLLQKFDDLMVPLLGLAVGANLVVVFHDLIPHSFGSALEGMHYIKHIVFFVAGLVLMYSLVTYLPHSG